MGKDGRMTETILNVEQTPPILNGSTAETILEEFGYTIETSTTTDETELIDLIENKVGLMVHAGVPVTRAVIEAGRSLRVIARCGIGVDNVDLEAAEEAGIIVVNHPTYSVQEVATHALAHMLAAFRRIPLYDRATRSGSWEWADGAPMGRLSEMTIGLVGFGSIGRRVAVLASGFGSDIIAFDPYVTDATMHRLNVEPVALDELCERANIVSVHAELTEETAGLIGANELAAIEPNGVLVNTARGPIIDLDALVEELEHDGLGYVGLDVADPEPLPPDHALYSFENVSVSPHAGWYSERSREELSHDIATDVGQALTGEPPVNPVIE